MDDSVETRNALWRRENQLRQWDTSETNGASALPRDRQKSAVKFNDGCVFLAACSSGDTKEVVWLLGRGADINTANVDGLTALHQACIDDNLSMVKFLVEHGADIDAFDNEGWTALHATASCGFVTIARYLIEKGARLDAVNNDGELAIDLAEGKEMGVLLSDAMEKQGIDAETARKEEEELMLRDANQWLNGCCYDEKPHPKTGARALHVAAAKGYIRVIKILLEAGADVNAKDLDGWTALHAAAHWGQDEACKILAEHFGNLSAVDSAGRTPMDVADPDVERLLEELKKQQDMMKKDMEDRNRNPDLIREISPGKLGSRRTSVTRLSVDQKLILAQKNAEDERLKLQSVLGITDEVPSAEGTGQSDAGDSSGNADVEKPAAEPAPASKIANIGSKANEPTTKTETEKTNKINGQTPSSPPMVNGLPPAKVGEKTNDNASVSKVATSARINKTEKSVSDDEIARVKSPPRSPPEKVTPTTTTTTTTMSATATTQAQSSAAAKLAAIGRQPATTVSVKTVPAESPPVPTTAALASRIEEAAPALWRASLRKTGSADVVCPPSERGDVVEKQLPRSSSVSWVPPGKPEATAEPVVPVAPTRRMGSAQESEAKSRADMNATPTPQPQQPPAPTVADPYARYKAQLASYGRTTTTTTTNGVGRTTATVPPTIITPSARPAWTTPAPTTITTRQLPSLQYIRRQKMDSDAESELTKPTTTVTPVVTTSAVSGMQRRSSEIPKRDEEKEIERKARARRARESRRSTQGVSKEDVEKAGASLQAASSGSSGSVDDPASPSPINSPTSSISSVSSDRLASNPKPTSAVDATDADPLSSYRKSRDSGTFTDIGTGFSTGFMRSLRDAGLAAALASGSQTTTATSVAAKPTVSTVSTASTSAVTTTTQSITAPKTTAEHSLPGNSSEDGEDSVLMSAATRARRRRETRRPLGVIQSISLDNKTAVERRADEDNRIDTETSGKLPGGVVVRTDRLLPATCLAVTGCSYSLVPSTSSATNPQTSVSGQDDPKDFKAMYEQERRAAEQLQTELRDVKRELSESRAELERMRNSASSIVTTPLVDITSERRERRALERKISELEEELKAAEALRSDNQRLREENGALIRVISKLSK